MLANPQGRMFRRRNVGPVCNWSRSRGLHGDVTDPDVLVDLLVDEGGLRFDSVAAERGRGP
jgi:hypothetical protein